MIYMIGNNIHRKHQVSNKSRGYLDFLHFAARITLLLLMLPILKG